ncbi:hypothetical protein [Sulfitobacter sp.]|uniref:hypothetical protein n=1 Tax=Sulfitobacter sp. TaxID=1903071 RepID=UPI0030020E12
MTRKRFSPKSRNALVVLGMHRSGTSALAGVLARLGCDLPQTLMPANPFNEKGYYESIQLYQMNDAILASGGARWDDWQPFNPEWVETHRAEEFLSTGTTVLEEEFGASHLFVLKDPRVCLVMPFWNRLFKQEKITPTYVHIHRNPVAVATSLNTRDGMSLPYGMLLWLRHTLDAETGSRGATRCFTRYDLLLDNWSAVVANIKECTGLVFPRDSDAVDIEIDTFLSADLNNSDKAVPKTKGHRLLSNWVEQIYAVLERWSDTGEDPKDFSVFDAVRKEFDATAPLFGKLIREGTQHKAALDLTTSELAETRQELVDVKISSQGSIRDYEEQAQDVAARLKASEAETQSQIEETANLLADLTASAASLETLEAQRLTAERTNAALTEDLTRSAQELETLRKEFTALDQEKWQLQSTLAQRTSETEDLTRQNAKNAERINELTLQHEQQQKEMRLLRINMEAEFAKNLEATLTQSRTQNAQLQGELDAQKQAHQQLEKTARTQRATLQADFEKTLETTLVARRKQSDQQLQQLTEQEAEQRARIEEVAADNWALRNSTSWKITKPLRSLVLLLRSR